MRLSPGDKIGRFTVLELLGEGGMGTVYAVRDPQRPEEALALKVLRADMAASAELRERFAREAKTVGGLYKRGIVWAIEADAHGSPAWLLMERVAGLPLPDGRRALSLAELRKAYGDALPEREIARLLDLCLDGLYAAHATGVVHRDLKPENILLDSGGETDSGKALEKAEPKIADFGLVALRETKGDLDPTDTMQPPLTMQGPRAGREGALLGTWDFMAPEQKKGQPADKRSDTYAMTLIAFWLLTGKNLGVNKAGELRPALSPSWEAFLERGYAPDPAARYQDAAEMRQALQPVIRALANPEKRARDVAEEKRREGERDLAETRRTRKTRGVGYWVLGVAVVLAGTYWGCTRYLLERPRQDAAGKLTSLQTRELPAVIPPPRVLAEKPDLRTIAPTVETAREEKRQGEELTDAVDIDLAMAGYKLAWADEFNGHALDTTTWAHRQSPWRDAISVDEAVTVADGCLTITTYTENGYHYTGMLSTRARFERSFGYYEARIKFSNLPGGWSTFELGSPTIGTPMGDPAIAGIDIQICRHFGAHPEKWANKVSHGLYWDGTYTKETMRETLTDDLGLANGFHRYGMEWTANGYRFFVDGKLTWTVSAPVSRRPEYLILGSEVHEFDWAGKIPAGGYGSRATSTTKMVVDYVRFYERSDGGAPSAAAPSGIASTVATPAEQSFDLGQGAKLELLLIPAGRFMMSSIGDQHEVTISKPFYLGKYKVTQEQWQAIMGSNPSHFKGPRLPVETVTWSDCQAFLKKLQSRIPGRQFALPTREQWEYAARAGSTSRLYCFGDDTGRLGEYAWYADNSGDTTHPVGEKKPNAWGLYDIHGNVWEWSADQSPPTTNHHYLKGGGWKLAPGGLKFGSAGNWRGRTDNIGFRVLMVDDTAR